MAYCCVHSLWDSVRASDCGSGRAHDQDMRAFIQYLLFCSLPERSRLPLSFFRMIIDLSVLTRPLKVDEFLDSEVAITTSLGWGGEPLTKSLAAGIAVALQVT